MHESQVLFHRLGRAVCEGGDCVASLGGHYLMQVVSMEKAVTLTPKVAVHIRALNSYTDQFDRKRCVSAHNSTTHARTHKHTHTHVHTHTRAHTHTHAHAHTHAHTHHTHIHTHTHTHTHTPHTYTHTHTHTHTHTNTSTLFCTDSLCFPRECMCM